MTHGFLGPAASSVVAVLALALTRRASAHEPEEGAPIPNAAAEGGDATSSEEAGIEVLVQGDARGGDAASRVRFGRKELDLLPRLRPGDILESVPGVFAVQHAGGGKANQYFLRGFDADHGTDVRITVDGVPVNMVSHGHGQGYADLHFLIPELVVGVEGYKGASYAHLGDFATAGAIEMQLAEAFPESFVEYTIGRFNIHRGLAVVSPHIADDWHAVVAAEVYTDDGPFQNPEDLLRVNAFGRLTHHFSPQTKASLTWMSYGSGWNGSGQLPARAICGEGERGRPPPSDFGERCIDRFGTVDPSEGGATQRHMGQLAVEARWGESDIRAMAYVQRYDFNLYSNFTFFAEDPIDGDGIEQIDRRTMAGAEARARHRFTLGSSIFTTSFGLEVRYDAIEAGLFRQRGRERGEARVHAEIDETAIGVYAEADARLSEWLRWTLGVRFDRMDVAVTDLLEDTSTYAGSSSGAAGDMLLSPKASVTISPFRQWDLFASAGHGFHSNDARGAVLARGAADLLVTAKTYELGTRVRPVRGLKLDVAGFLIDLDSETVWVGDAGGTEPSGATRRLGAEATIAFDWEDWLFADVQGTIVQPRYKQNAGNGDAVALAPTHTLTASFGLRPKIGDFTPFGGVRFKGITDRPATEDGSLTADGFAIVDLNAGLRWRFLEAALDVQNLFDIAWREVNFATETRLAYEPAPVSGIHYSPGWPATVMGRLRGYF